MMNSTVNQPILFYPTMASPPHMSMIIKLQVKTRGGILAVMSSKSEISSLEIVASEKGLADGAAQASFQIG